VFRNYLTTALRNIVRHKLYSFINIAGLAVGLACVIFILLFIRDDLSYDKWIPGTQNLYRVEHVSHLLGRAPFAVARNPFPMAAALHDGIPDVVAATRLNYNFMTLFAGDRQFRESVAEVDPNFFQVIMLPLTRGNAATIFRNPESVVISESAARKYFGTTDAIGKVITTAANCEAAEDTPQCRGRLVPLRVTGVMRDIPHNSQLDGDVFVPNTSMTDRIGESAKQTWSGGGSFAYVMLARGAKPESVVAKMAPILDRALSPQPSDMRRGSQRWSIHLTPFTDVHLTSGQWRFNEKPPGSRTTLYGAGVVGILVLLIACFNFMNLSTARALLRAREIALRKTHGARRAQLVVQFLGEAVLMALISLVLALALVEILQPAFGQLLQHPVTLDYAHDGPLLLAVLSIAIVAGLISGSYPALVLSGFRPIAVLRASNAGQAGSGSLRTILVVLQFAVSIGLGIAAAVVFSQISFARNIDLGFRKDNLLVIPSDGLVTVAGRESFVQRLRSNPNILDVAVTNAIPFGTYFMGLAAAHLPGHSDMVGLDQLAIGTNTAQLLGMRLIAGRLLSDNRAQDRINTQRNAAEGVNEGHNVLVDDTAAADLGFTPRQAVGKTIIFGDTHLQIVGVVAKVKFGGAREPAVATMYIYDPDDPASVLVRLRPGTEPQTLAFIDRIWHQFAPTKAMDSWFMDDVYGRQYRSDERQGEMFGVFVIVAIFIACMGLFGLAAFTAGRRTKEIGIRKAFGARTRDLVILLLWQFSIPVLIANAIAWPLAWYYLHGWLQGFAYHISLSPLYFLASGAAAMVIAWATVFVHARRVASANPIHALRYE
jgi:putative ABC transport system permease protein